MWAHGAGWGGLGKGAELDCAGAELCYTIRAKGWEGGGRGAARGDSVGGDKERRADLRTWKLPS